MLREVPSVLACVFLWLIVAVASAAEEPKVQKLASLNAHAFDTKLIEVKGHTHYYYGAAARLNPQVWDFLKAHKLAADPKFQQYQFSK